MTTYSRRDPKIVIAVIAAAAVLGALMFAGGKHLLGQDSGSCNPLEYTPPVLNPWQCPPCSPAEIDTARKAVKGWKARLVYEALKEGEVVPHNIRLEARLTIKAHYSSLETARKAGNWQVLVDGLPDIPNLRDSRSVDILAGDFYYWHGRPWADNSCPNVPRTQDATI